MIRDSKKNCFFILSFLLLLFTNCNRRDMNELPLATSRFEAAIPASLKKDYKAANEEYRKAYTEFLSYDSVWQNITDLRLMQRQISNSEILQQINNELTKNQIDTTLQFVEIIRHLSESLTQKFALLNITTDSLLLKKGDTEAQKIQKNALSLHKQSISEWQNSGVDTLTMSSVAKLYQKQEKAFAEMLKAIATIENLSIEQLNTEIERHSLPLFWAVNLYSSQVLPQKTELEVLYAGNEAIYLTNKGLQFDFLIGKYKTEELALEVIAENGFSNSYPVLHLGCRQIYPYLNSEKEVDTDYVFRIQLFAMSSEAKKETLKPFIFDDSKLLLQKSDNLYKYFIGDFSTYQEAAKYKAAKQLHTTFVIKADKKLTLEMVK